VYSISGWFKFKRKRIIDNEQELCDCIYAINNRNSRSANNPIISLLSQYIRKPAKLTHVNPLNYKHRHPSYRNSLNFFINYYRNKGEKRERKLESHYKTLKENVLNPWLNHEIKAERQLKSYSDSLITLYVSIIEQLKTPIHFGRLRSHLIHEDNKELRQVFEGIEKREPAHNNKVSMYMGSIDGIIKNAIINKDAKSIGDCKIDHIVFYGTGPEERVPNCVLRHAILYYINKAQQDNLDLDIRQLYEDDGIFQLHTTPDMIEIGRGDQQTMKCLLKKLKVLESSLIEDLRGLINEKDALVQLFNSDFKIIVRDMIADIDDGYLSGECRFELRLRGQKLKKSQ
jgi:hypothetical protein